MSGRPTSRRWILLAAALLLTGIAALQAAGILPMWMWTWRGFAIGLVLPLVFAWRRGQAPGLPRWLAVLAGAGLVVLSFGLIRGGLRTTGSLTLETGIAVVLFASGCVWMERRRARAAADAKCAPTTTARR